MVPAAIEGKRPDRIATGSADETFLKFCEIVHEVPDILRVQGLITGPVVCPQGDEVAGRLHAGKHRRFASVDFRSSSPRRRA